MHGVSEYICIFTCDSAFKFTLKNKAAFNSNSTHFDLDH